MKELIRTNLNFILQKPIFSSHNSTINKIATVLNKDKLIILSGLKNVWKTSVLKEFLTKAGFSENCFYFNKDLDTENQIKNLSDLNQLMYEHIKYYNKPKIIILQNTTKVDGIKDFILKSYKSGLKIILVWNTIKIPWKQELEIKVKSFTQIHKENLWNILKYGLINEVSYFTNPYFKEKFLTLIKNDIILKDIYINFGIKNITLYNFTLSFLSKKNVFYSLRDLEKTISKQMSISLKTTIDYIDYSIESKIIKRMYKFDMKKNKEILSKAKYYFSDIGIRNCLNGYTTDKQTLKENLIYTLLLAKDYKICGGLNGTFEFSFLGKKMTEDSIEKKIYIQLSEQTNKIEIKKEINRFLKIWDTEAKMYVIVDTLVWLEKLWFRKRKYENVEILEYVDMVKELS